MKRIFLIFTFFIFYLSVVTGFVLILNFLNSYISSREISSCISYFAGITTLLGYLGSGWFALKSTNYMINSGSLFFEAVILALKEFKISFANFSYFDFFKRKS